MNYYENSSEIVFNIFNWLAELFKLQYQPNQKIEQYFENLQDTTGFPTLAAPNRPSWDLFRCLFTRTIFYMFSISDINVNIVFIFILGGPARIHLGKEIIFL